MRMLSGHPVRDCSFVAGLHGCLGVRKMEQGSESLPNSRVLLLANSGSSKSPAVTPPRLLTYANSLVLAQQEQAHAERLRSETLRRISDQIDRS